MKESFKTQRKIVAYAVKKGIKIAYNPSLYMTKNGAKPLKEILKYTNILILNKQEVQSLVKDPTDNIYNLVFEASRLGPKIVIVTDGENGAHCYVSSEEIVYSAKPKKTRIVETTGAGDAFASGFVAATIIGKDVSTALKVGMINAESVIGSLGPKNILLGHQAFAKAERDNRIIFKKKL
jgi:sugar/nucleoside kinase (ribokinase family)